MVKANLTEAVEGIAANKAEQFTSFDVDAFDVDRRRTRIVYTTNEGGFTRPHALDARTLRPIALPPLPPAVDHVAFGPTTPDGRFTTLGIDDGRHPTQGYVVDWSAVEPTSHPGETGTAAWRTVAIGNVRARLVEYSAGYVADHWCERGHVIYVLEGQLVTELKDGRTFVLGPGQTYVVADGDGRFLLNLTEEIAQLQSEHPLGPDELARLSVFLVSDYARCITGQLILADAGAHLSRSRPPAVESSS